MIIPGVQKPHWSASCSTKAFCKRPSSFPCARPSMVMIFFPWAFTARVMQEQTARPSSSTVHAPHSPWSHVRLVPVRFRRSRRASTRVTRGSSRRTCSLPFTFSRTSTWPGPSGWDLVVEAWAREAGFTNMPTATAPLAIPAVFRNFLLESFGFPFLVFSIADSVDLLPCDHSEILLAPQTNRSPQRHRDTEKGPFDCVGKGHGCLVRFLSVSFLCASVPPW